MLGRPAVEQGLWGSGSSPQDLVEAPKENLLGLLQVKGGLLQGSPGIVVEVGQRLSASCQGGARNR